MDGRARVDGSPISNSTVVSDEVSELGTEGFIMIREEINDKCSELTYSPHTDWASAEAAVGELAWNTVERIRGLGFLSSRMSLLVRDEDSGLQTHPHFSSKLDGGIDGPIPGRDRVSS